MNKLRIVVAQIELTVGALEKNKASILEAIKKSRDELKADLVLFPELCITGYPPEDLLLREDFHEAVLKTKLEIVSQVHGIDVIISFPHRTSEGMYNAAALVRDGDVVAYYYKQLLPNYSVFDEKRYFIRGKDPLVFELKNFKLGLTICEDIWFADGPVKQAKDAGAELILAINASPFCIDKADTRKTIVEERAQEVNTPLIYAHNVGAHDELVFDGGSMAVNANGDIAVMGEFFKEELILIECSRNQDGMVYLVEQSVPKHMSEEELTFKAIVQGVRTYVHNSGYKGALVGLSGGIDSAVTLPIAVAALGAENVEAVIMPFRYTADYSIEDAVYEAEKLGVRYHNISIEQPFDCFSDLLAPAFENLPEDITEQNLQARIRGVILMSLSNKLGKLVLTTGNKSEMAVGYATLYGDMAGGYAPIKDVFKGMVYRLANYINSSSEEMIIPKRVITRLPSAELAPGQTDQDSLPPYDVLDSILLRYVVKDMGLDQIAADGFERETVAKVIDLVDKNEYKRRQAAPGVRISAKAFGRDRRFPIISGYKY
ncbi:MAG: NAD+ synthase [Gammaproteobacteria bacterium]|nr:NAD+ synthase [Gammaproteobacteria bacterium]